MASEKFPPDIPPQKPLTPASDEAVLEQWKNLFRQYTVEEGMKKSHAYVKIAAQYATNRVTVYHWLNEDVRSQHRDVNKNRSRPNRYDNEEFRLRSLTLTHVRRHLDLYVAKAFQEVEAPLSLEEVTLRIHDILESEQRPGILMRNNTLQRLVDKYDPPLLQRVEDSAPPLFYLTPDYRFS